MGSTPTPRRSRARRLGAIAGAAVLAVGLAGCSQDTELGRLYYPEPVTEEGPLLLSFWQNSWIAAWVVGFLTWGLILWAIIAYRKKTAEGAPMQTRYNMPLEILYTVTPAIMIFALFIVTARDQAEITKLTPDPDNRVGVVGFKWNWGFNYEEGAYDVGTVARPAELWLPVDERTRFSLTSPDVIHSFWVPQFLFKMDVIPGRNNQFELTPNQVGTFAGKCAELCGTDHSRMLFTVRVVERAEYDAHIAELKSRGQSGALETGRIVTDGVSPSNTGRVEE